MNGSLVDGLANRHCELRELMTCIAEVLSELADSEADAACYIPHAPAGEFSEGIRALLDRLRQRLVGDEASREAELFMGSWQGSISEGTALQAERDLLMVALDDILELAVWSTRPASSWSDIESRFRRFTLSLSTQLDRESEYLRNSSGRQGPLRLAPHASLGRRSSAK